MTAGGEEACHNGGARPGSEGENSGPGPGNGNSAVSASGHDSQELADLEVLEFEPPRASADDNQVKCPSTSANNDNSDGSPAQKVVQEASPNNIDQAEGASPHEQSEKPSASQLSSGISESDRPIPSSPSVAARPISSKGSEKGAELSGPQINTSSRPGSPTNSEVSDSPRLREGEQVQSLEHKPEESPEQNPEELPNNEPEESPEDGQEESPDDGREEPPEDKPDESRDDKLEQSPEDRPEESGEDSSEEDDMPQEEDKSQEEKNPEESPEDINDDSATRLEWIRQKRDEGDKNRHLDRLMCLIGLENVKSQFLSMKAAVEAAYRRRVRISMDLSVVGNPGTGKKTIIQLFGGYQESWKIPDHVSDSSPLVSHRSVKLADYSDEEFHEFLSRMIKKRSMDVEGGVGGFYTGILARRVGQGRGSKSFRNIFSIRDAFEVACDRQADRLQQEHVLWVKMGKQGDPPNDYFLTKQDLLGRPPADIRHSSSAYKELQKMTGLKKVKEAVEELMDLARKNYNLEIHGKKQIQFILNRVFLGPPGAGKTTVAKLLGQIIVDIGLVSKSEIVVKNPSDFISRWVGQAEETTRDILDETQGKVLIIDDAHALCPGSDLNRTDSNRDRQLFGILDTIVAKTSTELGQDRCIILIGYTEQMHDMFYKCNPGLRSRFPLEDAFEFKDYELHELMEILNARLENDGIDANKTAKEVASRVLALARDRPGFGNGRDVHNLVNRARASQKERASGQLSSLLLRENGNADAGADVLPVSLSSDGDPRIVLEPQDFDPNWERESAAGQNIKDLFKGFVGFDEIKLQFLRYQQIVAGMRLHEKNPRSNIPFTFVFKGPPGTGKTSTARKVAQIFYDMGFLSSVDLVECSATDLIGQHLGHTGPLVQSILEKALGKVLFIDEAYRLGSGTFEEEAVGELVDSLTKPRYAQKIVIILAGYSEDMDKLMKSNRGLSGRFATEVIFPQLDPDQCIQYLGQLIGDMGITIRDKFEPPAEKKDKVYRLLKKLSATRDWSNGRDIETLAKIVVGEVFRKEGKRGRKSARLQVSTDELIGFLQDMLRGRLAGELLDRD